MYDEVLAGRLRDAVGPRDDVSEQKMFGGLAFLVGGNMAVAASGHGGLLVRVDPAQGEALLAEPGVAPMEMRGRSMAGWLFVDPGVVEDDDELREWVARGVGYAGSLPPKPGHG